MVLPPAGDALESAKAAGPSMAQAAADKAKTAGTNMAQSAAEKAKELGAASQQRQVGLTACSVAALPA